MSAIVTVALGQDAFWLGGHLVVVRLSVAASGGRLCITESFCRVGHGPPYVRFTQEDRTYHVISGAVSFRTDDECVSLGAGGTIFVPRGVPASHRIDAGDPARMLFICQPGTSWEGLLRTMGQPAAALTLPPESFTPLPMEAVEQAWAQHGVERVGPRLEGATRVGNFEQRKVGG